MLLNYLKIAFRNLVKHKTFTLINLLGLVAGLSSAFVRALTLIIVTSLNFVFAQENENNELNSPLLEGPYLGQKPPGLIPEAFAPGIVTTEHYEFSGVFTPDQKEFY